MCQQLEPTTSAAQPTNSTMTPLVNNPTHVLTLEDVIDARYLTGDSYGMGMYQQPLPLPQPQPTYSSLNSYPTLLMTPPSPRLTLDSYLTEYLPYQQSSSPQQGGIGSDANSYYQQCLDIFPGLVPPKFNMQNFNPLIQASQISPTLFYGSYPPQQPPSPCRPIKTEPAESPPPRADTSPLPTTPQQPSFPSEPIATKPRVSKSTGKVKKPRSTATPASMRPKNIVCPHPGCEKTFSRLYNMRTHMEIHSTVRTKDHPCPECGLAFSRRHDMYRHQRNIHHGKSRGAAPPS